MSNVSMVNGHDDAVVQGDLISRSALLDAFGEAPLNWNDTEAEIQEYHDWLQYVGIVEKAPVVDAVEVVRCKDCTEWDEKEGECSHWYGFRENDFCSYGKRRADDERKTD